MASPILAGATALFGGLQLAGSIMQGSAARRTAEWNARVEQENAAFARLHGQESARLTRMAAREAEGRIRTGWGATGLSATEGTALDVIRASNLQYELDALKAEYGGEVAARGHERAALFARYQGRIAQRMGIFGAGAAGLSTTASIAATYQRGRVADNNSTLGTYMFFSPSSSGQAARLGASVSPFQAQFFLGGGQ